MVVLPPYSHLEVKIHGIEREEFQVGILIDERNVVTAMATGV